MAGLVVAGRVQVVLHARVAPPDLRLAPTGEAAGGDDHRFLEPARADPRTGSECACRSTGTLAIGPLLGSLRLVTSLTKEQRDQLPLILETIGPSIIPTLVRHLRDPHEHVRAIVAAALGPPPRRWRRCPALAALVNDPSEVVRQSVVEALGLLGSPRPGSHAHRPDPGRGSRPEGSGNPLVLRRRKRPAPAITPATRSSWPWRRWRRPWRRLRRGADPGGPWRWAGSDPAAAAAGPRTDRLVDGGGRNGPLRGGPGPGPGRRGRRRRRWPHWSSCSTRTSAPVKASAARALGRSKRRPRRRSPRWSRSCRTGRSRCARRRPRRSPRSDRWTRPPPTALVEGLASPDNVVRAHTAEALGTIGAAAEEAAPALVEAMTDDNDRVRAKAVEALGKIGEAAAAVAVPGLVRALRDRDNWVSALAAEALGQMGESADGAIPALVRSLRHINPEVRRNAAEALGKMGGAAAGARSSLERPPRRRGRRSPQPGHPRPGCDRRARRRPSTRDGPGGVTRLRSQVRAAAVESVGQWGEPSEADAGHLDAPPRRCERPGEGPGDQGACPGWPAPRRR